MLSLQDAQRLPEVSKALIHANDVPFLTECIAGLTMGQQRKAQPVVLLTTISYAHLFKTRKDARLEHVTSWSLTSLRPKLNTTDSVLELLGHRKPGSEGSILAGNVATLTRAERALARALDLARGSHVRHDHLLKLGDDDTAHFPATRPLPEPPKLFPADDPEDPSASVLGALQSPGGAAGRRGNVVSALLRGCGSRGVLNAESFAAAYRLGRRTLGMAALQHEKELTEQAKKEATKAYGAMQSAAASLVTEKGKPSSMASSCCQHTPTLQWVARVVQTASAQSNDAASPLSSPREPHQKTSVVTESSVAAHRRYLARQVRITRLAAALAAELEQTCRAIAAGCIVLASIVLFKCEQQLSRPACALPLTTLNELKGLAASVRSDLQAAIETEVESLIRQQRTGTEINKEWMKEAGLMAMAAERCGLGMRYAQQFAEAHEFRLKHLMRKLGQRDQRPISTEKIAEELKRLEKLWRAPINPSLLSRAEAESTSALLLFGLVSATQAHMIAQRRGSSLSTTGEEPHKAADNTTRLLADTAQTRQLDRALRSVQHEQWMARTTSTLVLLAQAQTLQLSNPVATFTRRSELLIELHTCLSSASSSSQAASMVCVTVATTLLSRMTSTETALTVALLLYQIQRRNASFLLPDALRDKRQQALDAAIRYVCSELYTALDPLRETPTSHPSEATVKSTLDPVTQAFVRLQRSRSLLSKRDVIRVSTECLEFTTASVQGIMMEIAATGSTLESSKEQVIFRDTLRSVGHTAGREVDKWKAQFDLAIQLVDLKQLSTQLVKRMG